VTNFRFGVTMHNFQCLYDLVLFSMECIGDGGTVDVSCMLTAVSKAHISETWTGPAVVLTADSQFMSDAAPSRVDALPVVIFFVPVVPQYGSAVYFSN